VTSVPRKPGDRVHHRAEPARLVCRLAPTGVTDVSGVGYCWPGWLGLSRASVLVLVGPVADFLADDLLPRARAQALNRMHRLFLELVPGGAPVKKSASQYKALLAAVRPVTRRARCAAGWPQKNSLTSTGSTPS